jgi:hypothetical protein
MEDLKKYTETELLKLINDIKKEHDKLKKEITKDTYDLEELDKKLNDKIDLLTELERKYVEIIEEFESR